MRFAMDRAGLVGADGATHCGAFDITYMAQVGNAWASTIRPACIHPAIDDGDADRFTSCGMRLSCS